MERSHPVVGCAVAVLLTSVAAHAHAYTLKTTPEGASVRWHRPAIDLEVMPVGADASLTQSEVLSALRRSTATWSAAPGTPELRVREGLDSSWGLDGVNGVYVLAPWPFEHRRLAVTVSSHVETTGELIEADVLINGEMPLAVLDDDGERDRYDLELVITHELGHVLGLDESDVPDATMWHHIGRGETHRRELAVDDLDGALALYEWEGPAPLAGCNAAPSSRSTLLAPLLAALALRLRSRRRRAHR